LTTVTGRPSLSLNSFRALVPIQAGSMLAAVRTTPLVTTAGKVTPMGESPMSSLKCAVICSRMSATAAGEDTFGVTMRSRSLANSPVARSTGAPLMPVPPMSMPSGWCVVDMSGLPVAATSTSFAIRAG